MHAFPPPQGLYDGLHEHDACGVAFVATLTGEASHDIVAKAITALRNLEHRGATGAEPDSGDGAGILLGLPDAFLREVVDFELPAAARVRRRHGVPARRRGRGRQDPPPHRGDRRRGGPRPSSAGATCRSTPSMLGATALLGDAHLQPAVRRRRRRPGRRDGARAAGVLPAQAGRARDRRVLPVAVLAHHRLQGHAHHRPARPLLPRPGRRARRLRGGRRALAVLHQHLPELAAVAPVPVHRAQRRDQHRDGQPQLDAGPRGAAVQRPDPRRPGPALPDLHARRVRLRVLRRGARAAAPRRPLAAALGADDDPRGVGEPRRDGRRPPRVLRVPLHDDGAVGRPRLRRLHRRHPDRRGPRPQRPAPLALLGHRRRPGRAGLRGRRARHRPGDRGPQGPPPARPDVPGRHRRAPDHRGRGDQGRARRRAPVRRVAARRHRPLRGPPRPRAHRAHARLGHPAPADLRLHRGGEARPAHPDGRRPVPSRSARWAPTPRSRRCPTGRGCCSTTSRSCSRRSPTRRWTRSARSSSPRCPARSAPRPTCSSRRRRPAASWCCRSRWSPTTSWPRSGTSTATATCPATPPTSPAACTTSRAAAGRWPTGSTRSAPRCRPRSPTARGSSCSPTGTPPPSWRRSRRCC